MPLRPKEKTGAPIDFEKSDEESQTESSSHSKKDHIRSLTSSLAAIPPTIQEKGANGSRRVDFTRNLAAWLLVTVGILAIISTYILSMRQDRIDFEKQVRTML